MALHLAERGVHIVGTYHSNEDAAQEVARLIEDRGAKAVMLQLDTGDARTFEDFAGRVASTLEDAFSRTDFDFLVNNAGIGVHAPFRETTEDAFDRLIAIHLKGPYFLTQHLLPFMAEGGRILNVSTGLARFTIPGYSAYAAAKGGIEVLTRYLANELADRKITVNTVAPGAIETDFAGGVVRDTPTINNALAETIALGRVGLPDDIGAAVADLLTGGFGWVTGQRIEVSGGQNV